MTGSETGFSLIETMRCEVGGGILRGNLHGKRLANSARKLGFAGHEQAWGAVVERAAAIEETSRIRLELFADGRFDIAVVPFVAQSEDTIWTVRIATAAAILGLPRRRASHLASLQEKGARRKDRAR